MYETKTSQHNFNYGICRVSVSDFPHPEHNSPIAWGSADTCGSGNHWDRKWDFTKVRYR